MILKDALEQLRLSKARKARQAFKQCQALVETPGDLSEGVVIPATCDLYVSTDEVLPEATVMVTVNGRDYGCPASVANTQHHIGRFELGASVVIAETAIGNVQVYVRGLGGQKAAIATGSAGPGATVLEAARFNSNIQGARFDTAFGAQGALNFELQALVYLEGARAPEDRIMMVQFPASRQAGMFCSNLTGNNLVCGDSQTGSVGGGFAGDVNPDTGRWCLLTFSANNLVQGAGGLWRITMESLDGEQPFAAGGRAKGVEASLTGNRVDLNGGGLENGFLGGIRFAEVRGYNAQRTDEQRQADLTNLDPTGALFWWRFSDNGAGGLAVADLTGNGRVPTFLSGTLAEGPTI
jgi:hypothetical protein